MKTGIFISGTDTGVGKTLVSSLLVSSLHQNGIQTGYFKPIQTGSDKDTDTVCRLTGISESHFVQPAYEFLAPQAPNRAAMLEGKEVQLDYIVNYWNRLDNRTWVVEGAGGLLVPLNSRQTTRDLIHALNLRMILVASTRLGTINHTLLSVEAARAGGVSVEGIVLVGHEDPGLASVLTEFSGVPVIAQVPFLEVITPSVVRAVATVQFSNFCAAPLKPRGIISQA